MVVAAGLAIDPTEARATVHEHAFRTKVTADLSVPSGPTPLPIDKSAVIVTYAACSLARGGDQNVEGRVGALAGQLVANARDRETLVPFVLTAAAQMARLAPDIAFATYFEPDQLVRGLARRAALRTELRRTHSPVAHIPPAAYEHPSDKAALDRVRSITGFEMALRKISELSVERTMRVENLANKIRVGPNQFPDLYWLFLEAAEMLGFSRPPELFLEIGPLNAYTVGIDYPQVILSSAVPGLFSRSELLFILGHELGHVRSGHAPFQLAKIFLPQLLEILGQVTLGIGSLVGMGVEAVLYDWYRKSELTCDRCGLLACQDSDAALSVMMKLAGAPPAFYRQLDLDAFVAQADEYDGLDQSGLTRAYKFMYATLGKMDHPWLALRARELLRWVHSGAYSSLLPALSSLCTGCGATIGPDDVFCVGCGLRVGQNPGGR